ncbi:hypothetical protein FACS1894153_4060 [Bacteroidia bacterium]|nr:hypothetical protein FACS1894153_4060 [Bacteroidia bacterium]
MTQGNAVYFRGFGSFTLKLRKQKKGRNIKSNTTIDIPAHYKPSFKPAKPFANSVKDNVKK